MNSVHVLVALYSFATKRGIFSKPRRLTLINRMQIGNVSARHCHHVHFLGKTRDLSRLFSCTSQTCYQHFLLHNDINYKCRPVKSFMAGGSLVPAASESQGWNLRLVISTCHIWTDEVCTLSGVLRSF